MRKVEIFCEIFTRCSRLLNQFWKNDQICKRIKFRKEFDTKLESFIDHTQLNLR